MDNLANMFSLGRGGRANVITQGGRTDDNTGAQMGLRRNSGGSISNEWDDASAPYRDDHSAPSVSARLGGTGDQTPGEIGAYANVFAIEGGGAAQTHDTPREIAAAVPPRDVMQWGTTERRDDENVADIVQGGVRAAHRGTPYSGMATAIRKGGHGTPATMIQELAWQRSVGGETNKITQWKEVMGSLQEFKAYLFVKQGSCYVTVLHSPMKFAAINAATQHLQGRIIGFVGDRTVTREPTPILLPQQKTWQWVKEAVFPDGEVMVQHFESDLARAGTLWKGEGMPDNAPKMELNAPRLLAIPLWLLDHIRKEGRALMPYEVLRFVYHHLNEVNTQECANGWATVVAWCILAAQGNANGESLVAFSIEAITEVEDEYLGKWLEQRLDTTMGPRPQAGEDTVRARGGPTGPNTQASFAADIGKGVALGLKALGGPMAAVQQQQGTTKEGEDKTRYTEDDIAAIMGFSHVQRGDQVQPIWATLNNAKQKNFDIFRRQLLTRMTEWGYNR